MKKILCIAMLVGVSALSTQAQNAAATKQAAPASKPKAATVTTASTTTTTATADHNTVGMKKKPAKKAVHHTHTAMSMDKAKPAAAPQK